MKKYLPALICLPSGVQGPQNCDFRALVFTVIGYIEQLVVVVFALSLIVFLWGIFKYIFLSQGEEKNLEQAKSYILYGIIGLFVMVSVWGIVNLLNRSFFGV
jgi:hypothetical protein